MATYKKLKSGNWNAQIKVGAVRESRTYPTKREAEAWATHRTNELRTQTNPQTARGVGKTVAELFTLYKERVSPTKKGRKWEENRIERSIREDAFTQKKCDEITSADMVDWAYYRQNPQDPNVKPVSGSTVIRDKNLYNNIFNYGISLNWLAQNPFTKVKMPKANPPRQHLYTEDEIAMVRYQLGWPEDLPVKMAKQRVCVAFLFACETAMRIGEICKFEKGQLKDGVIYLRGDQTKGDLPRGVPLSTRARELLTFIPEPEQDSDPRFGLKAANVDGLFRKYISEILPHVTFHDTRHYGTTMLSKKMGVLELAKMTGHTDLKILLKVYYNIDPRETVSKLD